MKPQSNPATASNPANAANAPEREHQPPVGWLLGKQLLRGLKDILLYTAYGKKLDPRDWMRARVFPVGRLDYASEGLLLLTNDGELAHRLMHPRYGVEKTYLVQVAGVPRREDLQKLLQGVWLAEGHVKAKSVKRLKTQGESTWLRITLSEGKNREIRRMLARLHHKVMRLRRVAIGPVELGALSKGKSRRLSQAELEALRYATEDSRKGAKTQRGSRGLER